jgi:hypothetical protein
MILSAPPFCMVKPAAFSTDRPAKTANQGKPRADWTYIDIKNQAIGYDVEP